MMVCGYRRHSGTREHEKVSVPAALPCHPSALWAESEEFDPFPREMKYEGCPANASNEEQVY